MDNYVGFSTQQYESNGTFILRDVEIVKQDLKNHIFTRKGERRKMYNFGTRIPDLIFQPLDENSLYVIEEDLNEVFEYDPRVRLIDLRIIPLYNEGAVVAIADLEYLYLNLKDRFDLRIEFSV